MHTAGLSNKNSLYSLLAALALLAAAVLIYANTLNAPFVYDDDGYIVEDSAMYMVDFDLESIKKAAFEGRPKNRPLPNISFALNFYFGRLSPVGYHWVNIGIHILTAVFLFFFCRDTLALYAGFRKSEPDGPGVNFNKHTTPAALIAFLAALIWLAHPVNSSAVTYIVQRMTSLAVMFYILSLMLYIKGRKSQRAAGAFTGRTAALFLGAALAGICALFSKQNTATLPIFILLYEWVFFQQLKPFNLKQLRVLGILAVIIFAAAGLYYLGGDPVERILSGYGRRDFTPGQRVLTEFRVVIYYIGLFFYPNADRLILDHDYPLSQSLAGPATTIFALAAILACIALAVYRPKRHILLSFAIIWFFGHLVIESTLIPIEIIYEHRNYLPYMMPCLLAAVYLSRLLKKRQWLYIGGMALIILLLGLETHQRNMDWKNLVTFWEDGAVKAPHKFRPHANLGSALLKQGKAQEAAVQLETATRLQPEKPQAVGKKAKTYTTLADALLRQNDPEEAIANYKKALKISPGFEDAVLNIARALIKQDRAEAALDHLKGYLKKHPDKAKLHMTLGDTYIELNNLKKAGMHFKKVLELEPYHTKAYNSLGNILAQQGKRDAAINNFQKAIKYNPESASAYNNLANTLAHAGKLEEAIKNYKKALAIDPGHEGARENMEKVIRFMESRQNRN
ncbi:MAG: tetratricopeptide repeat protein [Desulfobacterales bacterium]|nr:tetratricopeptide repeat protein [Desulfobacterales bacterium]